MMDVDHLIGIPFKYGGRGPDTYDCYGLIMHLLAEDGIMIPDVLSPDNYRAAAEAIAAGMGDWRECELRPGGILGLTVRGVMCHVGYVLDKYNFVHTWEYSGGVTIEPISLWKSRIVGCYEFVGSRT